VRDWTGSINGAAVVAAGYKANHTGTPRGRGEARAIFTAFFPRPSGRGNHHSVFFLERRPGWRGTVSRLVKYFFYFHTVSQHRAS